MAEQHPGLRDPDPDLEPPTQELKIIGSPEIEVSDKPQYSVHLRLSRKLTLAERDGIDGWVSFAPSPAGAVYVDPDNKRLTVTNTTIEQVAEHRDYFQAQIVSKIVADGEEYRMQAVESRRQAAETAKSNEQELARRRKLAEEISFDS
jgi:hypothetical protein